MRSKRLSQLLPKKIHGTASLFRLDFCGFDQLSDAIGCVMREIFREGEFTGAVLIVAVGEVVITRMVIDLFI